MNDQIRSIKQGTGEDVVFFTTDNGVMPNCRVDDINEVKKMIATNSYLTVYRGYIGKKRIFEIEAGSQIVLIYK